MDWTKILEAAGSQDPKVRVPAEGQLKAFEQQNFPQYLYGLCTELANESKSPETRQLAGVMLKNTVVAKTESGRAALAQRWLGVNPDQRRQIKNILLQTLASPAKPVRSTASLVIGKIASIEIPQKSWEDLVPKLVANAQGPNDHLKQSSFEALGYVCEEVPEHLQEASGPILGAIAAGMRKDVHNDIKLAATTALANSLPFVESNFNHQNDRNLIMQMVFSASQCEHERVRVAAYQCLVEIVSSYYTHISQYMNDIFRLTRGAIQKETEEVAQQAIEFWSSTCDKEIEILEEIEEAAARKQPANVQSQNFAQQALPALAPLLLDCLTKQAEEADDDTWDVARAAATCLGLLARTVGDVVVRPVLPFVQKNINNPNWRFREAAVLAFGCILEGPEPKNLVPVVNGALPFILTHLKDSSAHVKDTAAWTLGRICQLLPGVVSEQTLPRLIEAFVAALQDAPKIAANVCWAIHNLAEAVPSSGPSPLARYFEHLIRALLQAAERPDAGQGQLMGTAYEAINVLIQKATPETYGVVAQLMGPLMHRLHAAVRAQGLNPDEKHTDAQALLCSALTAIITKLDAEKITPQADNLMTLFLQVMQSKNSTVHEEALMAVGAVASRVGPQFFKYLPALRPHLVQGLRSTQEAQVCIVAIGVVGDVSRALGERIAPICDEVMHILLENLGSGNIERGVKPHIISAIADVALAITGHFERYLRFVMNILSQASQLKLDLSDLGNVDFLNALRESIFEAYTGILQGLSTAGRAPLFVPFVDVVLGLVDIVAKDKTVEDPVIKGAAGLIGDLANRLGGELRGKLRTQSVGNIIQAALNSQDPATQENGRWARDELPKSG